MKYILVAITLIPCEPVSKVSYKVKLFQTYIVNMIPGCFMHSDLSLVDVPLVPFNMS